MNKASKLAKQLHEKISKIFLQIIDCKKFYKSVKNPNKAIFYYYNRFENTFKQQSSIDEVNDDTLMLFNSASVEGLLCSLSEETPMKIPSISFER